MIEIHKNNKDNRSNNYQDGDKRYNNGWAAIDRCAMGTLLVVCVHIIYLS